MVGQTQRSNYRSHFNITDMQSKYTANKIGIELECYYPNSETSNHIQIKIPIKQI